MLFGCDLEAFEIRLPSHFHPSSLPSISTPGRLMSSQQKMIFGANLPNNQKWQVKEGRWWPLSVARTRDNWRSLSFCLESAQTTHCRKRLAADHFSETHYKRWANLKALPTPPQLVQIAVDLQRYPLQGCFSGDDAVKIIFFLKGFLSILSPWQLLKIC